MKSKKIISALILFSLACFISLSFAEMPSKRELPPQMKAKIDRAMERRAKDKEYKISNVGNIEQEQTPPDVYSKGDKAELKKMIMEAWKAKYPQDKILGIRFHMKEWKREKNVRSNETSIYLNDKSALAVSVVTQTDDRVATIFPAYINKDNQSGTMNIGCDTKSKGYVIKQMLVSNYKE